MGYTLAEVNDIIVENELLRDQIKDLETYNQELRDLVRELKAQLGYLRETGAELGTPVLRSHDGWVERFVDGKWEKLHEVQT